MSGPATEDAPDQSAEPEPRQKSPEATAIIFSRAVFAWLSPLFRLGNKQSLNDSDLYDLVDRDKARTITQSFDDAWEASGLAAAEKAKAAGNQGDGDAPKSQGASSVSTVDVLKRVYTRPVAIGALFKLLNSTLQFAAPVMLNQLLQWLEDQEQPEGQRSFGLGPGFIFTALLVLTLSSKAIIENQYFWTVVRAGYNVRTAITTSVYRKSLRLSPAARQAASTGEVVNLMQLDAMRLEMFTMQLNVGWDGIYQILGYMALLTYYLGPASFAGLAVMILLMPVQAVVMRKLMQWQQAMVKDTDERVKLTNEVLQGIKVIKLYNWEESFVDTLDTIRTREMRMLRKLALLRAFNAAFMMASPAFVAVTAFAAYSADPDNKPSASVFFTALALFSQLRFPLMFFPMVLASFAQARVAVGRINRFLNAPEVQLDVDKLDEGSEDAVAITDATFYWVDPASGGVDRNLLSGEPLRDDDTTNKGGACAGASAGDEEDEEGPVTGRSRKVSVEDLHDCASVPALHSVNLSAKKGSLVAVVGPVGSGKTSLCHALLGELWKDKGSVALQGSVAYASQTPWILNATVKDNILFGLPYDSKRYAEVLKACQLEKDLQILDHGDQTEIGERGINLSGGQKQRVSIARAAYNDADIIVFDDPLSALDAEVGKALFEQCIAGMLRGKTRVLVTNQLQYLAQCDKVAVLGRDGATGGRILEQGTYSELMAKQLDFASMMSEYGHHEEEEEEAEEELGAGADAEAEAEVLEGRRRASTGRRLSARSRSASGAGDRPRSKSMSKALATKDTLVQAEERIRGAVRGRVYRKYITASTVGAVLFLVTLMFFAVQMASSFFNQYWLVLWTEDYDAATGYKDNSLTYYLIGLLIITLCMGFASYARAYSMAALGINSSRVLHTRLLHSVLHAPMAFFDTHPIGRIITRFSKDLDQMDLMLPDQLGMFIFCVAMILTAIVSIVTVTPWFALAILPLGFVYLKIMEYYRNISRELKRLESISRGPVYSHFSETLGGLTTIRAYSETERFVSLNMDKVDRNLNSYYAMKASERWLSVRLELLGSTIVLCAALLTVLDVATGGIDAGRAGFSITFALSITGVLNWTVRMRAELENQMNSVERVLYYSEEIAQEAASHREDTAPAPEWPARGGLEVQDLKMRYRKNTPLVIKGMSFSVGGGEKIGVVGRTGSGKSSLMLALFRIVEREEGKILLDGVDIGELGLSELRSQLSIIPQDPFMFSGTVRKNLDPFNAFKEADLWAALERVGLHEVVRNLSGGLDAAVSEYGSNFSVGQGQLMCLARVLLRRSKVLLLDEATSSIDFETDAVIQRTIREEFADCTILTIAHRLNTIIDSDRILVLDDGQVAEFDSPARLLRDPKSAFSSLIGEMGAATAEKLRVLAEEAETANASKGKQADPSDVTLTPEDEASS